MMMRYQEGSASTEKRERGFLDAIAKHGGLEVISSNQYAGATIETAQKTAENLLNGFREVDGIFCPNESSAYGMLRALVDSGRHEQVRFVGFDSSEKLLAGLGDDTLRKIAVWKMQGYTNDEIGRELDVARRTVARKLALIRTRLKERGAR